MGETLQKIIPSYLYQQFADDADLQAMRDAYNDYAQQYLDWFNRVPLGVYTSPLITEALLDWIAAGIYGMARTPIAYGADRFYGPLNTYGMNSLAFNTRKDLSSGTSYAMTDDIFKRVITWNFYKGDGQVFSINWFKRRCARFLTGTDGVDGLFGSTYGVSVKVGAKIVTVVLSASSGTSGAATYLQACLTAGIVNLPIGYIWEVTVGA